MCVCVCACSLSPAALALGPALLTTDMSLMHACAEISSTLPRSSGPEISVSRTTSFSGRVIEPVANSTICSCKPGRQKRSVQRHNSSEQQKELPSYQPTCPAIVFARTRWLLERQTTDPLFVAHERQRVKEVRREGHKPLRCRDTNRLLTAVNKGDAVSELFH